MDNDVDVAYESVDLLTDNKASSDTLLGEHVNVHSLHTCVSVLLCVSNTEPMQHYTSYFLTLSSTIRVIVWFTTPEAA